MALFIIGLSQADICRQAKIDDSSLSRIIEDEGWKSIKHKVLGERALQVGKEGLRQREFIKGVELDFGRKLMGLAEQAIRNLDLKKPSVDDCCKLVRMASELSRLGAGMPLTAVEVNVTHDLSAELTAAINKVYGNLDDSDKVNVKAQLDAPIEAEVISDNPNV